MVATYEIVRRSERKFRNQCEFVGWIPVSVSHPLCTFDIVNAELLAISDMSISTMNIGDVRRELTVTRTEKARLVAREIALVARMEALLTDETAPAFVVPEHELMAHAGMSSREARDAVNRSHVAELAPAFGEVLAEGRTTPAHLDLLGRGLQKAGADTEAFLSHSHELARAASTMNLRDFQKLVDQTVATVRSDDGLSTFERQRQNTYLRTWIDGEGMTNLRGRFDPVSGAAITSVLEQRVDQLFHSGDGDVPVSVAPGIEPNDHRRAHALVERLTRRTTDVDDSSSLRAEVVVHIDLEMLTKSVIGTSVETRAIEGRGALHGTCRTNMGVDLPVETVRRLACEADIIPVVLDGRSVPIDVGRSKRLATANQRRALEAVHPTCAIPDCDVPFHRCQIHHIDYWENGGRTDLDNQVPLCTRHHHAAHEGGWTLSLDPSTRVLSFQMPTTNPADYRCRRDTRPVGLTSPDRRTRS